MLNYDDLDPGIRLTVRKLREAGFDTTDSGDGETKVGKMECALDVPNVAMICHPLDVIAESDRLWHMLQRAGIDVGSLDERGLGVQGSYDPADPDQGVILLLGVSDASWPDQN